MRLEILAKENLERLGFVNKFKYVQYIQEFCGPGEFKIIVPLEEESVKYLVKGNYIWFEYHFVGIIEYTFKSEDEKKKELTIRGSSVNKILSFRTIPKTEAYHGTPGYIVQRLVFDHVTYPSDNKRAIQYVRPTNPNIDYGDRIENIHFTGKDIETHVENVLSSQDMGYFMYVVKDGNIVSRFWVISLFPNDRTIGSDKPVVFSFDMDNLSKMELLEDYTIFKNYAYIAGEDSGENRKVVEFGDNTLSGIDRIETYIDARDVQSEKPDGGTYTDEEYEAMLKQRGIEKLKECSYTISIDAVLNEANKFYEYNYDYLENEQGDFKLGDFVSVIDSELGLSFDLQISAITKTISENGDEHFDVKFGKDKITINELVRKGDL